jgi:hypothetical protein
LKNLVKSAHFAVDCSVKPEYWWFWSSKKRIQLPNALRLSDLDEDDLLILQYDVKHTSEAEIFKKTKSSWDKRLILAIIVVIIAIIVARYNKRITKM